MSHPLDRPVWWALCGAHAGFDPDGTDALRYPVAMSPLGAARDGWAAAGEALVARVPLGDELSLLEVDPPEPPTGWTATRATCVQLVARRLSWPTEPGSAVTLEPLGEADAEEMLALATLTRPGPFRIETHRFGRFLGVREQGRLVAMAGERLRVERCHEVSGVCTHPEYRGRGYGTCLLKAVAERMVREGSTPFLHTYGTNVGAIALYERLGFERRTELVHAVWRRAG